MDAFRPAGRRRKGEKIYSWNKDPEEEIWKNGQFDSVKDCIRNAEECGCSPGDTIYIGICEDLAIGGTDLSAVLEAVEEDMYSRAGEVAEGWEVSRIPDERRTIYEAYEERLTELVQEYIDEIGETPYFYQVTGIRPVIIGQEWKEEENGTDRKK